MTAHKEGKTRMKKVLIWTFLLFCTFGCSTIPKGPLMPDEVRLINLTITEIGHREEGGKHYKGVAEYQRGEKVRPEEINETCLTFFKRG